MAVNKVVYGNDTLMDITDTTATAEDVASGKVFYGANGTRTTGSASYTETDPIYSASAAATISSSDITNWNSKVGTTDYGTSSTGGVIKSANALGINTTGTVFADPKTYAQYTSATDGLFIGKGTLENVITGKGLVSNTDYANSTTGGVIKTGSYGFNINASGNPYPSTSNYATYLTLPDYHFIGKGTLENVITGKNLATKDDIPIETLDFSYENDAPTSEDNTRFNNIFNTLSTSPTNGVLYNIKFTYYDDYAGDYVTSTRIGSLYSIEYDATGTSTAKFNVFPSALQDRTTIYKLIITLKYYADFNNYNISPTFEDYNYPIKILDFVNSYNDERLKLFQTLGETSLIDDYSNQTMKNYGLYYIIVPISFYGNTYTGVYFGTLINGSYNETGVSYLTFSVLSGGHNYEDDNIPSTKQLMVSYTYNDGSYTLSTLLHSNISTSIDSTSNNDTYPTSKAVYDFVTSQGGGGGSATDVQINGTSITSNGTANILTNTAYNASSNKIATMSDIPSLTNYVTTTDYANSTTAGVIKNNNGILINSNGFTYGETLTYSDYSGKGNQYFISKGTLENVITGKGLVSNTDYASSSTGGVVKLSGYNGLAVNNSGNLYPTNNTYAEYQSAGDTWAISKGTLENVITGKGLVSNTDYAGAAAAGVIMTASGAGTYTGATGILYSSAITYANYPSYSNNGFISKGTLENVITGKNLISTSGATMTGALVAQNNTDYTTKQVRNVVFSTSDPTSSDGGNGDIWIKYS